MTRPTSPRDDRICRDERTDLPMSELLELRDCQGDPGPRPHRIPTQVP